MDPISIVAGVAGIIFTCLKITKTLHNIRPDYHEASATIAAICSESTLVSASLSQIQNLILKRTSTLAEHLESRSDLTATLDTALTGCTVVFACLEEEVARLRADVDLDEGQRSLGRRVKTFWKADSMQELLQSIRGQQGAITLLTQILQMESIADIQRTVKDNTALLRGVVSRTRSLRSANPSVNSKVPGSVLRRDSHRSNDIELDVSTIGGTEFEFDDELVNAKVYRRALSSLQHQQTTSCLEKLDTLSTFDGAVYPTQIRTSHDLDKREDFPRADSLFSFDEYGDDFWSTAPDLKLEENFGRFQMPEAAVNDRVVDFSAPPEEEGRMSRPQITEETRSDASELIFVNTPAPPNSPLKGDALHAFEDVLAAPTEPNMINENFNLHLIAEHNRLVDADMQHEKAFYDIQRDLFFEDLALAPQVTATPLIHFVPTKPIDPLPSAMKRKAGGPQRFIKAMSYKKKKKTVSFQLPQEDRAAVEKRLERERNLLEERRKSWERRRRRPISVALGSAVLEEVESSGF